MAPTRRRRPYPQTTVAKPTVVSPVSPAKRNKLRLFRVSKFIREYQALEHALLSVFTVTSETSRDELDERIDNTVRELGNRLRSNLSPNPHLATETALFRTPIAVDGTHDSVEPFKPLPIKIPA